MTASDGTPGGPTTVVVPLDGSAFAEAALRPAAAFAIRVGDGRLLLTCRPDEGDRERRYLADRADRFRAVVDIDVRIVTDRSPADAILETVATSPRSMLCMATHGHGGLRTALWGSVAEDVIARTSEPILLVGPQCRTALLPGEVGDIVVTSDGSASSEAILPAATDWARQVDLTPWLVEVVPPDELAIQADEPQRNREVEDGVARLEELAARVEVDGAGPHVQVLHGADPARSIVAFAEELPAAVVATQTHGRTGLARSLMGSVAADIVRTSPCPVLLARSCERDDDTRST